MDLGHRSLARRDSRRGAQLRQLHEAGIALAAWYKKAGWAWFGCKEAFEKHLASCQIEGSR